MGGSRSARHPESAPVPPRRHPVHGQPPERRRRAGRRLPRCTTPTARWPARALRRGRAGRQPGGVRLRGREGEPLRACCVPESALPDARRSTSGASCSTRRFFDAQGRAAADRRQLCARRGPGLPERADFDEGERRWGVPADCHERAAEPSGGSTAGRGPGGGGPLRRGLQGAEPRLRRATAPQAGAHLDRSGRRHGPHRARFVERRAQPLPGRPHRRGARRASRTTSRWAAGPSTTPRAKRPHRRARAPVARRRPRPPGVRRSRRGRPRPGPSWPTALAAEGQTAPGHLRRRPGRRRPARRSRTWSPMLARHTVALHPGRGGGRWRRRRPRRRSEPVPALLSALVCRRRAGRSCSARWPAPSANRPAPAATSSRRRCCWRPIAR